MAVYRIGIAGAGLLAVRAAKLRGETSEKDGVPT